MLSREDLIERIEEWRRKHGKRTYKTGTVFQLQDGSWCGFVSLGKDPSGKRLRKKVCGQSQEIVEAKVEKLVKAAGSQRPASRPLSNRSLDQLRKMYMDVILREAAAVTE